MKARPHFYLLFKEVVHFMLIFFGDSILGSIHNDVFKQFLKNEPYVSFCKKGIRLQDLVKSIPEHNGALQSLFKAECAQQSIHVVISIGTNDMITFPCVLENMREALLEICTCIRKALLPHPVTISFIGLAAQACTHSVHDDASSQTVNDAGHLPKKRKRRCGTSFACERRSFNETFNTHLQTLTSQNQCLYLASPTLDGSRWCWKDSVHLLESEHTRYLRAVCAAVYSGADN